MDGSAMERTDVFRILGNVSTMFINNSVGNSSCTTSVKLACCGALLCRGMLFFVLVLLGVSSLHKNSRHKGERLILWGLIFEPRRVG